MEVKRFLVFIALFLIVLSSCASPGGTVFSITQTPEVSSTRTPLLPTGLTLSSGSMPTQTIANAQVETPTSDPTVNLEAVGDIMLARTVGQQILSKGPQVVFAGVQPVLDGADVLVGNLECALTSATSPQPKTFTFAAPPEAAKALALAGFDVLGLANNHAMDYGAVGLADTINNLQQNGIASAGAGMNATEAHTPVILERNGLRLAFLAYANVGAESGGFDARAWIATESQPGIAWADPDQVKADVTAAKKEADVVIVLLHSGYEITSIIPNISDDQRLAAHAAIDAGAALVIGSHPHFLQSIERYHGGLIAYSLGNFVFDDYQGIANATIILRVVLNRAGFQSYEWVPVLIKNGLPELTDVNSALAIGTMVAPLSP